MIDDGMPSVFMQAHKISILFGKQETLDSLHGKGRDTTIIEPKNTGSVSSAKMGTILRDAGMSSYGFVFVFVFSTHRCHLELAEVN